MTRENLLLAANLVIAIGIGIYGAVVSGEPSHALLTLPLLSILLVFLLFLYVVTKAEKSFWESLDHRLPPVEHLETRERVEQATIELATAAQESIATTGGRSRNHRYLETIRAKVAAGDVTYWRILFEETITHEMCEHLRGVVGMSGVAISRVENRGYGHFLVTDGGFLVALPLPKSGALVGMKVQSPTRATRLFRYLMLVSQHAVSLSTRKQICELCERCSHSQPAG